MRHWLPALTLLAFIVAPSAASALNVREVQSVDGTQVWFEEEHSLPMIAVSISFPAGSAYDPKGLEGLAAMATGMLDEGAGEYSSNEFKEALEARAINLSASVDRDFAVVTLTTLTENADEAFRLLALSLQKPRFDPDPFALTRSQIIAAIQQDDEDPSTVAGKAWYAAYFGSHPYAHSVRGTPETIARITQQQVRTFAVTHWVRAGARIAVAGDITEAQLRKYLDAVLGPLPATAPPPLAPPAQVGKPGVQVIPADVPQPAAVFGLAGPLRRDPDFIPTYVANYIFGGGGFSSRLMKAVREKRGLTYGIETGLDDNLVAAVVIGSVASDKNTILTALDVTKEEMARFAREGATDDELADAKTYLTGSFPLGFDSNAKIVGVLNGFQRGGLPVDYVVKRNGFIEAVTLEDINRVARRYFDPVGMTVVVAGTPAPVAASGAGSSGQPSTAPAQ